MTLTTAPKAADLDFSGIACLLDLLADHPAVTGNDIVAGGVAAIKAQFVALWDRYEADTEA